MLSFGLTHGLCMIMRVLDVVFGGPSVGSRGLCVHVEMIFCRLYGPYVDLRDHCVEPGEDFTPRAAEPKSRLDMPSIAFNARALKPICSKILN